MAWSNATASGTREEPTTLTTYGQDTQVGTGTTTNNTIGNQSGSRSGSSVTTNLDPQSMGVLQDLIKTLIGGGTANQRAEIQKRDAMTQFVTNLMGLVSPDQAKADAQGLMSQQLQKSMESQMPALQKAIEGAGTSASSMQGLLANRIAQDAATNAAALGGEQAKAYASNRSQLASILEAFTRPNNTVENNLIQALQALKGAVSTTNSVEYSNQTSNQQSQGTQNSQQVSQRGAVRQGPEQQQQQQPQQQQEPRRYVEEYSGDHIGYNPVNTAGIDNGIVIRNTTDTASNPYASYDGGGLSSGSDNYSYNPAPDYSSYSSADDVRAAAYANIDAAPAEEVDYSTF